MARPRSIRRSLLVNLIVVVVVLSVAILTVIVVGVHRAVRTLSEELIAGSLDQVEERLRRFFDPVASGLRLGSDWGREGLLDLDRPEAIDTLLAPILRENRQIDGVIVGDDRGREHLLRRAGGQWMCRETRRDEWGARAQFSEWTDAEPEPVTTWADLDYDPRTRPWFAGALERARAAGPGADPRMRINWTEPYRFFTTNKPGITASVTFEAPGDDNVTHVIGFDVLLDEITVFTQSLRPSPAGIAFVMTYEGRVIGLPRHERFADPDAAQAAMLKEASELDVALIRQGTAAYFKQPVEQRTAYRFRSDGRAWWAGARPFELGPDRLLLIAIGVPESDMLGNLRQMRLVIIAITLVVLGGAIWRAVRLAGRYSRPVEALVRQSDRISRGDLGASEPIESEVLEILRLAAAHDHMRRGLLTLMKLERDLQIARQIQEATFPGSLPELPGFEIGAWSRPADETGGDTYDVVVLPTEDDAGTPRHVFLLLADATGHGIGPALSVTQVRAMLRMAVRAGQSLARIAQYLNDQLFMDLPEGRFITAWFGALDVERRELTSHACGQGPVIHYEAAKGSCEALPADDLPLGVAEHLDLEIRPPMTMAPGDIVAVISDGIFEAPAPGGELFGASHVMQIIAERAADPPAAIIDALREAVEAHTGGGPLRDDQTGIVVKAV